MTSIDPRPWWASDGPVGRGPDPAQDPVEVHRAARRGAALDDALPWWSGADGDAVSGRAPNDDTAPGGAPNGDAAPGSGPNDDAVSGRAPNDDAAPGGAPDDDAAPGPGPNDGTAAGRAPGVHRPELCGICPICTGFRALEELRPDLVAHLSEAARHLAAAFRALAETTATPPSDDARGTGGAPPPVQHIDLD